MPPPSCKPLAVGLSAILAVTSRSGAVTLPKTCAPVGNRKQMTSTLAPVPAGLWNYDANDRFTAGDSYDADGNTISSGGIAAVYDFENHLIQKAGVSIVYDGDGNRVSKTVAGVTTTYLVDTLNPTGYAQVVYESFSGGTAGNREQNHSYVYGLELISQVRNYQASFNNITQRIYYVYDGHGSVRALTDPTGAVTDTYDYDAFGNVIRSSTTLSTPTLNNYLFAGEQFDPDLGLYYNRARYLNVSTGRFWTMDSLEGDDNDPLSLHKFLYAEDDAVNNADPTGNQIDDVLGSLGVSNTLNGFSTLNYNPFEQTYRTASTISYRGIEFIELEETFRARPYDDGGPGIGNCTVGYGHLIEHRPCTDDDRAQYPNGITKDAAEQLLFTDLFKIALLPMKLWVQVPLAQKEFDALADFTYNIGGGGYATKKNGQVVETGLFGSQTLQTLNQGFYSAVPDVLRTDHIAPPIYERGLRRRRNDEANLWSTGIYYSSTSGRSVP